MPPKKKKSQTRLTFEPVGPSSSSPVSGLEPAKVRYIRTTGNSSPIRRRSPVQTTAARRSSRKTLKQGKLEDISEPPSASFMPNIPGRGKRAADSSEESADEIRDGGYDEGDVDFLTPTQRASETHKSDTSESQESEEEEEPIDMIPRSSQSVSTRLQKSVILDDSDDEELEVPRLPSPRKRRRSSPITLDDSDDDPILPPNSTRKLSKRVLVELDESDEEIVSPSKRRKILHRSPASMDVKPRTPGRLKRPIAAGASSPTKSARKGHRSEKQKKMELLRRRRAGEKIHKLTSSESSSSEDEKRGIYDSDQDDFEVLRKFEDEEEEEEEEEENQDAEEKLAPRKKDKRKRKKFAADEVDDDDEEGGSDLDDFVTDDDDAPLGVPIDIPLEFTSQAHKPLKEQFPYVIEWLVHNRINPAFERRDPVYVNAWRKLDDEFSGLANSKFTSSAWRSDFHRALRSRPRLEAFELPPGGSDGLSETCEACGRSGHPSTWKIVFAGSPYHKYTLADIESPDTSSSDDSSSDSSTASVDTQGMALPPTSKEWSVGAVCCSNAETAHSLLHWKHALKEWVEEKLEAERWMTPEKLREREKMMPKKRRRLTYKIVDAWQQKGTIGALYGDFKNTLENARNKQTTGRGQGRFR